jgi:hypothetical protein
MINALKYSAAFLLAAMFSLPLAAQDGTTRSVSLEGAREVVATINGGFGTLYLKRGRGNALLQIKEKNGEEPGLSNVHVEYEVEDGIGYLTLDLNTDGDDDMNALACLLQGKDSRTWYVSISDRVPVDFDVTLGAGRASLDLTGLHVKGLRLDAGAGTVRMSVDRPNRQIIDKVSISAGIGSVQTRHLGNLRFRQLEFDGGLGSYRLDCTGALPARTRISSDVGVGSMIITLPEGVGAKALTSDHWLSSESMYRFVQRSDNVYATENFAGSSRKVLLDLQSGVGSISVRWAR